MKRWIIPVLIMLLACTALAEGIVTCEIYEQQLTALFGAEWSEEDGVRVLQTESGATVSVCPGEEGIAAVTIEAEKGGALAETAADALNAFVFMSAQELAEMESGEQRTDGGYIVGRLEGELRECFYAAPEADFEALVWAPVHGGSRLHARATCSGMDVSRLVTREVGEATGYDWCGNCAKELAGEAQGSPSDADSIP